MTAEVERVRQVVQRLYVTAEPAHQRRFRQRVEVVVAALRAFAFAVVAHRLGEGRRLDDARARAGGAIADRRQQCRSPAQVV
jgi:hypothetical protein